MNRHALRFSLAVVLTGAVSMALAAEPPAGSRGVRVIDPDAPLNAPPRPAAPAAVMPPPAAPRPAPTPLPTPSPPIAPPPVAAKCDRAFVKADLAYADTAAFDSALSAKLTSGTDDRGVIVDTPPFAPEVAPPGRLAPWLSTIQTSGGAVNRRDITCSRAFNLMRMLKQMFSPPPKPDLYAPARAYNAVLWVESASGQVRQVQFMRRE